MSFLIQRKYNSMTPSRAKIFCVDDDEDLLHINSTVLQSAGYDVIRACSGNECLSRIREVRPDLVLLDVMLPDANGFDVCRKIKEDPELLGTSVILISGLEISSDSQVRGLQTGADGYLVRPISGQELLARIQSILRIRITEMALRKSMEQYQMLVETMNEGLGVVNETLLITFVNDKLCEMTGYTRHEILYHSVWELLDREDEQRLKEQVKNTNTDLSVPFELKCRKKDGKDFFAIISPKIILNSQNKFKGAFAVVTDITKSKQTEEALKSNLVQISTILESVGDGVYGVNTNGNTIFVNSALLRMTGYQEKELIGKNLHFILRHTRSDGAAYERTDCPILATLTQGETFFNVADEVIWRKDGTSFPVEYTSAPITEQGEITGAVVVIRDITERRQIEQERKRLNQKLEQRVVERTIQLEAVIKELESEILERRRTEEKLQRYTERLQVLSNRLIEVQEAERRYIAQELHDEIGQSLTGIKLALDMMIKLPTDNMEPCLNEVQKMIQELLRRVRSISLDLRPSMLDDLGLLPTLLWHFDRFTTQTNIRVKFRHDGLNTRFRPEVETAAYRIAQEALTNVARHACISEVDVLFKADREKLFIHIEDKGVGFDYSSAKVSGNSAGLKGMNERLSMLGGRMTVDSSPGYGTKLTATIPVERAF
jgi:PAS domain S-box-containing protein